MNTINNDEITSSNSNTHSTSEINMQRRTFESLSMAEEPPAYSETTNCLNSTQSSIEIMRLQDIEQSGSSERNDRFLINMINICFCMCVIFNVIISFDLKMNNNLTVRRQTAHAILFGLITIFFALIGEIYHFKNKCKGISALRINFIAAIIFALFPLAVKFENENMN